MRLILKLCVALGFLLSLSAFDANHPMVPKTQYSADAVYKSSHGEMRGKIYHGANFIERREMNVQGVTSVMIIKPKEGMLMLMPQQKMAMRMKASDDPLDQAREDLDRLKYTAVGTETVNGESTTKYKVTYKAENGEDFNGFFWVTKDGILTRMEAKAKEGTLSMNALNIKRGAQPKSLFELPAGYRVMDMGDIGAMMKMGGQN